MSEKTVAKAAPMSLVNISARQRMLSQRMLLQTVLAAGGDQPALESAKKSLALFIESHGLLLNTVNQFNAIDANKVRHTYDGPEGVRPRIERFIKDMQSVLASLTSGVSNNDLLGPLVESRDSILDALNTATTTFDSITKSRSDNLMRELTNIVTEIQTVAREAKVVSFNAQVIAARAGEHGREFAVLANALSNISTEIDGLSKSGIELAKRNAKDQ